MYAHITVEEFASCSEMVDKASAWMYDMLDKQGGLAANVDPVITAEQIYGKSKELNDHVSPIMNKPIPKPKVEEKKPEEEKKKDDETKKEGDGNDTTEPMDTSEPMTTDADN